MRNFLEQIYLWEVLLVIDCYRRTQSTVGTIPRQVSSIRKLSMSKSESKLKQNPIKDPASKFCSKFLP